MGGPETLARAGAARQAVGAAGPEGAGGAARARAWQTARIPAPPLAFTAKPFAALTLGEFHALVRLREEVFVVGQRITTEAEIDGLDPQCVHVLGRDPAGEVVATARLFTAARPVKVGRICVALPCQRRGLGSALMRYVHTLLDARPPGERAGVMSAQAHLVPWYEQLGWTAEGPVYDECGIPHRRLRRPASA